MLVVADRFASKNHQKTLTKVYQAQGIYFSYNVIPGLDWDDVF
jgi:hypothetical protein